MIVLDKFNNIINSATVLVYIKEDPSCYIFKI